MSFSADVLKEEYIGQIAELEKECFGREAWSENLLRAELGQENKHYTVICLDGKVVAYGGFAQVLDEGHIMNIAVRKEYRRQGYAKAVLRDFSEKAKKYGVKRFTLEVRESNLPARKLYEAAGFEFVGIRKGYYSDKENCCIYWSSQEGLF